jgi:hypothetical protein
MTATSPFRTFGAAMCRDQEFAQRLLGALEPFTFDGTEIHRVIDAELRGPENEIENSRNRAIGEPGALSPAKRT